MFAQLLLTALVINSATGFAEPANSEGPYTIIQGKMYYIFESPDSAFRTTAIAHCADLDMTLPDIASKGKEDAMIDALKSLGHGTSSTIFWISASRDPGGPWMWTNLDKEMSYTNWGAVPEEDDTFAVVFFRFDEDGGFLSWVPNKALSSAANVNLFMCQEKKKNCHQGL